MKDLNSLTKPELEDFFNSFDKILCDVHGVLVNVLDEIPGASDAVSSLQKLGKRFIVVSNNTIVTLEEYQQELKSHGFNIDKENIVTPICTTISFLKRQNFDKEIFVLGSHALKKSLRDAGFRITDHGPFQIEENYEVFAAAATEDDGVSVGAVIEDIDLNVNYVNLQKAATFLKRSEVLFLRGTGDWKFSLGMGRIIIGPGQFHRILEEMSERAPISMAKPSSNMNDYIVENYKIEDPSRVLFIGDSVPSDMGFATNFGYKKLLVLTGLTKEDALKDWKFPEEHKPDFYVDTLKSVHDLILRIFK